MPSLELRSSPQPCWMQDLPRVPLRPRPGRIPCTPSGHTPSDPEMEIALAYARIRRSLSDLVMLPIWPIYRILGYSRTWVLSHLPTGQVSAESPWDPGLLETPRFSRSTRGSRALPQTTIFFCSLLHVPAFGGKAGAN